MLTSNIIILPARQKFKTLRNTFADQDFLSAAWIFLCHEALSYSQSIPLST